MSIERDKFMVEWMMKHINTDQKTMVFCGSQEHAAHIRDLINGAKKSPHENYCVRVAADDKDIGDTHLKQFQDNEKSLPTILTTSHKLSTGVDARNVRNIVLMRPPQNIIEFKQIVGRGTRVFEGKEYFTIVDFVGAHELFNDPEWDGTPTEPPPPDPAGNGPRQPSQKEPTKRPPTILVKLGKDKMHDVQCSVETLFINDEGKPVSAEEYLRRLFDTLPDFFKDEAELRRIWSQPDTRSQLLERLAGKGFPLEHLQRLQKAIDASDCDLFDVLLFIKYSSARKTRRERSEWARKAISSDFNARQCAFLNFVLEQYVAEGFEELDQDNLPELLRLRYGDSLKDAMRDIGGSPDDIGNMFKGFQRHIYQQAS
jgi:type I restriction enzyme R subunit